MSKFHKYLEMVNDKIVDDFEDYCYSSGEQEPDEENVVEFLNDRKIKDEKIKQKLMDSLAQINANLIP